MDRVKGYDGDANYHYQKLPCHMLVSWESKRIFTSQKATTRGWVACSISVSEAGLFHHRERSRKSNNCV